MPASAMNRSRLHSSSPGAASAAPVIANNATNAAASFRLMFRSVKLRRAGTVARRSRQSAQVAQDAHELGKLCGADSFLQAAMDQLVSDLNEVPEPVGLGRSELPFSRQD